MRMQTFFTPLKCLVSGKKSIEQLCPSTRQQTSALELLVVYCFRVLLVYPCALYYGMLILSRAHGTCPPPLIGMCVLKFCTTAYTFSSILILHMFVCVWVCVLCVGVYLVKQVLRSPGRKIRLFDYEMVCISSAG